MAKYDHGGGCACGLHKECNCRENKSLPERGTNGMPLELPQVPKMSKKVVEMDVSKGLIELQKEFGFTDMNAEDKFKFLVQFNREASIYNKGIIAGQNMIIQALLAK